jgi:hypothetical protein
LWRKTRKLFTRATRSPRSYKQLVNTEGLTDPEGYKAAGCVFTDGKIILAGYQPRKKVPIISGIGGKKEAGETYMDTAIRETVEELFEVEVSADLINELKATLPEKIVQNGSYIIAVYTFTNLEEMLKHMKRKGITSKLYDTMPGNLMELIFNRKLVENPEISHLALLPLVKHGDTPLVDKYFIKDMPALMG